MKRTLIINSGHSYSIIEEEGGVTHGSYDNPITGVLWPEKDAEIAKLKSLVAGARDIVETWIVDSPVQRNWREEWLQKSREVVK